MAIDHIDRLDTPCLILDQAILRRNLAAMAARAARAGIKLRPHMKTAKSAEIGRLATAGMGGGITVSTLAEARYFASHGFTDILYGIGINPAKLDAVAALRGKGVSLKIVLDSIEAARAVAAQGKHEALIEIDCGQHRAGIGAEDAALIPIAQALGAGNLAGVMTHAGHSYHCRSVGEIMAIAEAERAAVVRAAERLRQAGFACAIVSAGSTPTAVHGARHDGLTEIRPGVYMFNDLDQIGIGSCASADLALTVLTSVVGRYPERNRLLVDAGALALSKDVSAAEFMADAGFGAIADPGFSNLRVTDVNQEHGFVTAASPLPFERLPIGARLRVLPNHACMTAAAYDRYYVVDSSSGDPGRVVAEWDRINGW